jgi:hypothetical protein
MEKKKAEALYKRSEAEAKKHKICVDLIECEINALEEKVDLKGQLSKTLKSKIIELIKKKLSFFYFKGVHSDYEIVIKKQK